MEIKNLIKQILVYSPGVLVPALTQFVALIVFTRLVDPDAYGRYALVVATAHFVDVLCLRWFGIGQLRFYEAENQKNRLRELLVTTSLAFTLTATALIPVCVMILLALPIEPALRTALMAGVGYMIVRAAVLQNLMRYRATGRAKRFTIVEVGRSILGFGAAVLLVMTVEAKEISLLMGITIGYALVFAMDIGQYRTLLIPRHFRWDKLKELIKYLWPVIIQLALVELMGVIDRYMLGFFLGAEKVGLYSVGFNIAKYSIGLLFTTIVIAAYPLLLKEFETHGIERARNRIKHNAAMVLAICLPATAGLAMVSEHMAVVMLGKAYQATAVTIIPWIALSTLVTGVRLHVYAHVFQLFKRVDLAMRIMALVVGMNFFLNILLIPHLEITGAILATVLSDGVGLLLYIIVGRKLMPLDLPLRDGWRIVLATIIMASAIMSFDIPSTAVGLVILVSTGALIYAIAALLLDVLGARTHLMAYVRASK